MEKKKISTKRKVFIIIFSIVFIIILYIGMYSGMHRLPSKASKAVDLDYSKTESVFYLSSDNYAEDRLKADNYVKSIENESTFESGNATMCYSEYIIDDALASIVISHGYTECKDKYREMIYYYLNSNYNVFIMDHRGHGKSQREVSDTSLVYIDSMNTYVSDLKNFITEIVSPKSSTLDIILFGHSMGGGIATKLAEDYPDVIDLLILSAPMIKANLGMPEFVSEPFANFMCKFGNKKSYAIGNGPYPDNYEFDMDDVSTTSCEERAYQTYLGYQNEYNRLWGPSYSWVKAVISGTHTIQKKKNIKKISVPILLFQANDDSLVMPEGQNQIAKYAKDIEMYKVDAKHEIWNETNDIIIPYYNTIFEFISKHI